MFLLAILVGQVSVSWSDVAIAFKSDDSKACSVCRSLGAISCECETGDVHRRAATSIAPVARPTVWRVMPRGYYVPASNNRRRLFQSAPVRSYFTPTIPGKP